MLLLLAGVSLVSAQVPKVYKVFFVADAVHPKTQEMFDGFKATMDSYMQTIGSKAEYTTFDTQSNPANAPAIIKAIEEGKPDLICNYNRGAAFSDNMIAKKLTDPRYRFVSVSATPVEMGIIQSLQRPGGNITGVGVFLQFNSIMRFMKASNPKIRKVAVVSWQAAALLNAWFEKEVRQACLEEGIEFVELRQVASIEDEFAFYREYEAKGQEYFVLPAVTAQVDRTGKPIDAPALFKNFATTQISSLQMAAYDEGAIALGAYGGPCIIWSDIGAQLAEKGIQILKGTKPGDIPWDYPRRFNLVLNLKTAQEKNIPVPQEIISACYRVYTDYDGNFIQGN